MQLEKIHIALYSIYLLRPCLYDLITHEDFESKFVCACVCEDGEYTCFAYMPDQVNSYVEVHKTAATPVAHVTHVINLSHPALEETSAQET